MKMQQIQTQRQAQEITIKTIQAIDEPPSQLIGDYWGSIENEYQSLGNHGYKKRCHIPDDFE